MRPLLVEHAVEQRIAGALAVRRFVRIADYRLDRCGEHASGCDGVGEPSRHPKALVFRLPPGCKDGLKVGGVDRNPDAERNGVSTGQPDWKEGADKGADIRNLHHDRLVSVGMAHPSARRPFLLSGIENRVRQREPYMAAVLHERATAGGTLRIHEASVSNAQPAPTVRPPPAASASAAGRALRLADDRHAPCVVAAAQGADDRARTIVGCATGWRSLG